MGRGATTNPYADYEHADAIFCIGTNTTETHPVIALRFKKAKRRGAKLIVADPRRTDLAKLADLYLPLRPGSDMALVGAMCHVIVKEGLTDDVFIANRTTGYEELRKHLESCTPEWAEGLTGVPANDIRVAAIAYGKAERGAICYTLGITEHICGVQNVQSLSNLVLLTGNVGKRFAGINPLRGQNNVQGCGDSGALPAYYPGFQQVFVEENRKKFEKFWGVAPLHPEKGMTKIKAIDEMVAGKIKGLWIMGENTLISDPAMDHTEHALKSLDLLIVQDIFMTETAAMAHILLPSAAFAETDGTFTSGERRVQRIRAAAKAPGEARPDWWIVAEIARRMGAKSRFDFRSPSEVFDELAMVSPIYHGINYARIEERGIQWPCPDTNHPGTAVLHQETFPIGKAKFQNLSYVPPAELPDKEYPLLLTTGRRLSTYHTNTQTGRAEGFKTLLANEWAEIHPDDADALKIGDGETIRVVSRRGAVDVRAKRTNKSPPGVVFLSFAFGGETPTNRITNNAVDPVTDTFEVKVCAVRIEKAS